MLDIANAIGVVNQFFSNPNKKHWTTITWILRYLRGTSTVYLCFGKSKSILDGCTDANMADNIDSIKSISENLMTFPRKVVSWQSKLPKYVALSTIEIEYTTVTNASKELLWTKFFLQELGIE